MNMVAPQALANLWYLKYGHSWVTSTELSKDWKAISRELMKNNLADYEMLMNPQSPAVEIIKLKESYR